MYTITQVIPEHYPPPLVYVKTLIHINVTLIPHSLKSSYLSLHVAEQNIQCIVESGPYTHWALLYSFFGSFVAMALNFYRFIFPSKFST